MKPDWNQSKPSETPLTQAVQVWRVRLDAGAFKSDSLESRLASDELQQAQAFRHAASRARFICARIALRELLSAHLNIVPLEVPLTRSPHGKPRLHATHASDLEFNVSHSGQCALVVVARKSAVGTDVEAIRPLPQAIELAQRYFAPAEVEWLSQQAESERDAMFFRLWTRKEAQLKAVGTGLAGGLATTSTLPGPWTIVEFEALAGHLAAVAIRSSPIDVSFHDLTDALTAHR